VDERQARGGFRTVQTDMCVLIKVKKGMQIKACWMGAVAPAHRRAQSHATKGTEQRQHHLGQTNVVRATRRNKSSDY